jgi:hypothetical protein
MSGVSFVQSITFQSDLKFVAKNTPVPVSRLTLQNLALKQTPTEKPIKVSHGNKKNCQNFPRARKNYLFSFYHTVLSNGKHI